MGTASREGNPHAPPHSPLPTRRPVLRLHLQTPTLARSPAFPDPHPFKHYLESPTDPPDGRRGSPRLPLPGGGWGLGERGWRKSCPPGVGVPPHSPLPGWETWGGGWAGAEASWSRLSRRCGVEQMAGEGRGDVAGRRRGCGGRRMRNGESRRPESPRRSPPPCLFPERGAGKRLPYSRRALASGLWRTPFAVGRPGAPPLPLAPPARARPAGSGPRGAGRVARVNGAALQGARGRREAGSRAGSEFRDRK